MLIKSDNESWRLNREQKAFTNVVDQVISQIIDFEGEHLPLDIGQDKTYPRLLLHKQAAFKKNQNKHIQLFLLKT